VHDRLHDIIDATVRFFDERPDFRQLLRHIRGGAAITGPVLAEFATDVDSRFREAMEVIARVVRDGQQVSEIRAGDPRALAHMFSVLVNEYVLLASSDSATAGTLTAVEFRDLVDAALRNRPASSRPVRGSRR
jgi:AcrR family transcriptional regulator